MDERFAIWNVLHDGEITAAIHVGNVLELHVNIGYLRRRMEPKGDGFVLKLNGVSQYSFASYSDSTELVDPQRPSGPAWILSTESAAMPIVINTTEGDLTLAFVTLELTLDTGAPVTFEAIERTSNSY